MTLSRRPPAVELGSARTPAARVLRDRRCARCGQIDIRPGYAPPPPACFRCHARPFVAAQEDIKD